MRNIGIICVGIVIGAVVVLAVAIEVSVWNECRTDHSFFYCARVLR